MRPEGGQTERAQQPAGTRHGWTVERFRAYAFASAGARRRIDHRLTKPDHLGTDGPVERTNRALEDATVHRYHDQTLAKLSQPR